MRGVTFAAVWNSKNINAFLLTHLMRGVTAKYSVFAVNHHNMRRTILEIQCIIIKYEEKLSGFQANMPDIFKLHKVRQIK